MAAKFRQDYAKIAHILVLYNIWRNFFACTIGFSGGANLNSPIPKTLSYIYLNKLS